MHTARFLHTNGLRLHLLDYGGDGPPLLLLHGLTANAHAFDGLLAAGLGTRFRVLAPDLRGRGASDDDDSYTLADHAADVLALLDALRLARVALVGHSFGGLLAYYLAATHPQRVRCIVALDAAIAAADPRVRDQLQPALARLGQRYPSFEAYLATLRAAPYWGGWWDPLLESYYRADVRRQADGSVEPRPRPAAIAAVIEDVLAQDWSAIVRAVRQPVLLINAPGPYGPPGAPPLLSEADAHATVALLADGRYLRVPGNHMTMLYGPGARAIVKAIMGFLALDGAAS
ncbi:alpha/beta fold hydrolase [Kallotenue papyrolyticum]|uniref:alpha/beta fold hydrolase n=1 Tax=Kallotenue papyrolyticum TaxID=1325125 RepID=UPI0004711E6F|nr:alpha/beta fold hydrolase [Kallotenue papyrolyticum]